MRHGLLDEQMASGSSRRLCNLQMLTGRRTDKHTMRPRLECGVKPIEHLNAEFRHNIARVVSLQRVGHHMPKAATSKGQQFQPIAIQATQVARVPLTDRTESGNEDAHANPRVVEPSCWPGIPPAAGTATSLPTASRP